MPRPSLAVTISTLLFAAFSLSACKTVYTDMYRPKRNYFKPEKEAPKTAEELPPATALESPAPAQAPASAPGLDPLPAGAPAQPAAEPAVPAIPGL